MNLHSLTPFENSRKNKKRLGRGHGSAHGTTAGRGTKGQRARGGGKSGLKLRGLKQTLLRIPKLRGFKSLQLKPKVVNISSLEKIFSAGDVITPAVLDEKGLIKLDSGRKNVVKILGTGGLTKKITIQGCEISEAARVKIEKAGGTIA